METGVVTIQEPVSTKTDVGEVPAEVILEKSSMEVQKVNLSTVLDDEITSGADRGNNIITGEADVAEVVNGSGDKETEELKRENGEATKTISVLDDSKIVKDDQESIVVREPQSLNEEKEDEKIILSDVTLENKKEEDTTGKPEEVSVEKPVIEEDQTEAKHSLEQEEDIGNISKVCEEIPIKTDEVREETDSRTVETSVNGTEAEHNATVSVEEISRNGDNTVNETVSEDQTATDGEPLHDVETIKREAEPFYKTVVEDAKIVNTEETTAHESKILKEDNHQEEYAESVEATKNSDAAEQSSREVTVDKEKEEDIIQNIEEVQESPSVMESPTIQGDDIESKASLDHEEEMDKITKDTEEQEHVLVRDVPVPQSETLVTEAKTAETFSVQEAEILKTNINESEAHSAIGGEEDGQETKENTEPSKDLKDDKEQEDSETVKTIISSDEVRSSDVQAEVFGEHTEPCSSEIKDDRHGRDESIEVKAKETGPEIETAVDGESVHEIETTERVLLEAEKEEDKEEIKIDEEPSLNAIEKAETENVKIVIEEPEIVNNEETSVHESESLKENAEPVEAVKNSDGTEQISREVTVDRAKEEDIAPKTEEIQERPSESKASLEPKEEVDHISNETEEHEHVLERDVQQCETIESEAVETKEDTQPSLDLKEDKETEEAETFKTVFSSDEVRSSAVQEEQFGEHTEPCSSEIKDESHGKEESVEVKSQETVQDENTEDKHDVLKVPSTESEKYQGNEPETVLVSNTGSYEKSEKSPSDLVLNVDKEELNDEKINVDQVDGTHIMEEPIGLDSNGAEAEQIDQNITNETEEILVAKPVSLLDVKSVEQMQKPKLESPSEVSEETSKTVDEKIEEKPEEEVTLYQEGQVDGSYGLETKEETVSVPESIELEEQPQEERSVIDPTPLQKPTLESPSEVLEESSKTVDEKIEEKTDSIELGEIAQEERSVTDLTPLQEESSQPNEQEKETKLEKHEPTNEEVKSDEVIEVLSASPSKELEGETVVEAENIENIKENEEEQAAEKIQKSLETVQTVESPSSLLFSSEEQDHVTVAEEIVDEKAKEEVPMLQIKNEDDATKIHETRVEQARDIGPSLTEICSINQNQPEEQVKEACSKEEQEKEISTNSENIVNETYALHSVEAAEEETARNGESLDDVETTKSVLLEVRKEEEEAEMKTDAEPRLDAIEKEELETVKTVVQDAKIVNNEETTAHESESLKGDNHQEKNAEPVEATQNLDDAEQISREVTVDTEREADITEKIEKVQEGPTVIETPTIQGEDIESETSLELKEEVDQSSKDTEEHEHVLERDIPQCETLKAEAVDTSTVEEAAILKTLETNISEPEAMHSETSLDLKVDKEQKEAETVKTVIFSNEVGTSDAQAEEFGEHTEPCSSEIKDESQGSEESVEVKSKETVQGESSEEKDVNMLDVQSGESEKYQENEPDISLVSKTENGDKFEEIPSVVEGAGLDETTHNQTLLDVESVVKQSLDTPSEEETSKTIDEKIEDKPKEEVTLHQEGREEGSYGLDTKDEAVSVLESRELGEQPQQEELCLANEQENETKLQEEQVDKHEPTKEEVSNDQQSPVEEISNEVIQVSSASLSEGPEYETVVEAEKIGEEQVADKIQKSFETGEIVEAHSSLPSSSEEKEHETVSEKTDDEKVKDAEPIGDMRERGLDIAETTHLSLPSVDQKEDVDEIHIPSVALPLDEQEKVTSTEKGETKSSEAEDDKPDEHVDSSTSPMLSEKNDNETQTSKTSEDVCMQQEESGTLEVPKPEESKEDKSQEISETIEEIEATSDQTLPIETSHTDNTLSSELVSEQDDQSPKKVEEIHEEEPKEAHDVEATSERNLPVETSDADNTLSSQLVSETKEEHKLQAGEILPTEIIPRESSDEALVSMLASREDDKVALQEDNCADDVRETNDIQEERSISVETEESVGETKPKEHEDEIRDAHVETPTAPIILEENDSETLIAEAKKGNEEINETERTVALDHEEEFVNHEAPKLEETKDEKSQEIPETAKATETTIDQTLPIGTSQADQTPSLVSDKDDQTPKQVEEILEEETKETHKVQAEDIFSTETVPKESFIEAPVSMLASGEDEPVTPQEGDYAANTQEERHVSAETEEKVGETKPKESQAEGAEKSDDQVEDESTKKTDVEVAGLENDYPTEEAEHGDETYSTLPVVGILTQLQTTLETERAINDSASSEVSMIKEPADQEEKKGDDVVESNEKDFVSDILEAKRLHGDKSGEAEKIKEESGLAGISLPIEEINLQEEHKEEVKVQEETREIAQVLPREEILISSSPLSAEEQEHVISDEKQEEREPQQDFNGSTSEKISLQVEHLKDFETSKKEQKDETHETVKEEDQIVDIKDKKKDDEEQEIVSSEVKKDNKDARELEVGNDFVSRDGEKEEVPHNALENEEEMNEVVASEKQISDPVGVIKKASEAEHEDPVDDIKSNDDRDFPTEQAPKDQSDEVSADETVPKEAIGEELKVPSSKVLDDIQENSNTEAVTNFADRDLPVQNLSELIQSHQSPNQVEETSFEFNKAQEDKKEETVDALITNVQVQDQPKEDFEAAAIEKEISEQEHKLNDLTDVQEDIGTYVKVQVPDDEIKGDGHDSVAAQKEETSLIEEKREVEHVKAEMEDAIKHEVSVEEKNNTSENIDHEAAKEIEQEEGKQTNIVKEEIREEEKEINQESFNNVKETDDAIDKTQPEIRDIESLSSVSKTQDKPEPEYEVPNQQKREITNEVPSLENSKIEEELQKKDEESENTKDLFSVVKETEPTLKEPARKSLSDHIQKEPKTEEDENDDEDHEHKDDKTSPDSIVMVEAKDTVSIVKTHKKSHGILSGVGSKVKHSISKVKKVLTGKSSHTTKPSSPT